MAAPYGMNLFRRLKNNGRTADGSISFINEWDAVKYLGRGNFGVVYEIEKVNKTFGEQHSALKIIELDEKSIEKYKDEIAALNSIRSHPHGVSIEDFSELHLDEGDFIRRYVLIRMELLKPMPAVGMSEDAVIQMALDVSDVLADCHSQQRKILHCDIKPVNILMTEDSRYKLSDFGEARFLEKSHGSSGMRGTPLYMSPEMASFKGYDERSDLYSLGVTMYAMLNGGCVPFYSREMGESGERNAIYRRLTGEKFPKIKGVRPELLRIIGKLCELEPNKRYQRASQLNRDLRLLVKKKDEKLRRKEEAEIARRLREKKKRADAKRQLEEKQRRENERRKLEAEKAAARTNQKEKQNETLLLGETVNANRSERLNQALSMRNKALPGLLGSAVKAMGSSRTKLIAAAGLVVVLVAFAMIFVSRLSSDTIVVGDQRISISSTKIDLSNTGITQLTGLEKCRDLKILDIRGNDISVQEYERLQAELPDCDILWTVDICGEKVDSSVRELDLSGTEITDCSGLYYLPELMRLDMSGCGVSDDDMLKLRDSLEDCSVIWSVDLYGSEYASDSLEIDLSGVEIKDTGILKEKIRYFPKLKTVYVSDCGLTDDDAYALNQAIEDAEIVWELDVFGQKVLSNITSLDLTEANYASYEEVISSLKHFSRLNSINLGDKTLDATVLSKFAEALPKAFVLCNVTLGGETFRTDVEYLDLGYRDISDISVLGYCAKISYLHLGANKITDISPLARLKKLNCLYLSANAGIKDFEPLAECTSLRELNIQEIAFDDFSFISRLAPLSRLSVTCDKLDLLTSLTNVDTLEVMPTIKDTVLDISPLYDLKSIKGLILGEWRINDLEPLTKIEQLSSLEFWYCSGVNDVSKLSSLEKLQSMAVIGRNAEDIMGLEALTQLQRFNISGYNTNWDFLSSLNRLKELYIQHYDITEALTYLCEMEQLSYLRLLECEISDSQRSQLEEALPRCSIDDMQY